MQQAALVIIRYPKKNIPFAVLAMAVFHFPLWLNKRVNFYKLMGSGKNGTFDKNPDWQQWAIMLAHQQQIAIPIHESPLLIVKQLCGSFISGWLQFFNCTVHCMLLQPVEGHGTWDGKQVFGKLAPKSDYEGEIATLTRATIRLSKLKFFWQNVAPVAVTMAGAPGFVRSYGIGEVPFIKQATFSIWQSKAAMKAFAYGSKTHAEVIQKTRSQKWYSEDMFVRFRITAQYGLPL